MYNKNIILFVYAIYALYIWTMIKKEIEKLEQKLKGLQWALKNKYVSVNEYSDFVYAVSQEIVKLRKLS